MTKDLRKEYELVKEKYNEFMGEAVELWHDLYGDSYVIYKPFNEWASRLGLDIEDKYGDDEQRFFTFVDNIVYEIEYEVDKCGFELRDLGNRWRVLVLPRFDQWTQDDFSSLVHRLFEMNGCFDFGTRFEQTPFEEYIKYEDFVKDRTKGGRLCLELEDFIGVYDDAISKIKHIQDNEIPLALDVFGEKIVMNDFDAIYDRYVKHEMHLDELATARRMLVGIVERYRGDGYDE